MPVQIKTMQLFKRHITAKYFFPNYAPKVGSWKHKRAGTDGKRAYHFTAHDKKLIQKGIKQLAKDIIKEIGEGGV